MSGEVDLPAIEGKIVKNGVAANVTREGGETYVHLSFVPGHEPEPPEPGRPFVMPLPEIEIAAGETFTVTWESRSAVFPND